MLSLFVVDGRSLVLLQQNLAQLCVVLRVGLLFPVTFVRTALLNVHLSFDWLVTQFSASLLVLGSVHLALSSSVQVYASHVAIILLAKLFGGTDINLCLWHVDTRLTLIHDLIEISQVIFACGSWFHELTQPIQFVQLRKSVLHVFKLSRHTEVGVHEALVLLLRLSVFLLGHVALLAVEEISLILPFGVLAS